MEQSSEMELRLWEYIDGISDEPSAIEQLIAENAEWRAKYAELLDISQMLKASELEQPSLRFTRNVMDEIARLQIAPATKEYINKKIIWGIGTFFITVIVGFLIYGLSQVDWSTGSSNSSPLGIDFTSVDYSRMFNNSFVNLFMMLNVVLGLMLLDRYLNMKRKKLMEGQRF
jgi:preprotein translocase subunit Sss1